MCPNAKCAAGLNARLLTPFLIIVRMAQFPYLIPSVRIVSNVKVWHALANIGHIMSVASGKLKNVRKPTRAASIAKANLAKAAIR